ncbi:polysaccharide deacetylase family protein [Streptomyces sp. NPDC095613]|uniref:polysaccharide deacetylase family protein n=1 Tax=Streptomyces sp. NPDC095613 TaxID=3155540 RepID=UPI0033286FF4
MKKDQMVPGRRAVLRVAACLGAAFAGRFLVAGTAQAPGRGDAAGRAAAGAGAPGAGASRAGQRLRPSAYRLDPMAADVAEELRRPAPPVRSRPFLDLPELGNSVVLTFDDGPDPLYTPEILRTLREYDVRAMFFVCGEMADVHRDLLREAAGDGHVIGNHSWSHPLMTTLTRSGIRAEMGRTSEVVERVLGTPPLWYRAPYGAWNRHAFELGAELGMEPLGWSLDSLDWTEPPPVADRIVTRVVDGAVPGTVVLSHDAGGDRSQSVAALRDYLPLLRQAGYRIAVPRR